MTILWVLSGSALAMLVFLLVLAAQWQGHFSWLGFPLLENAWWLALLPPPLLLAYYLLRRQRAAGELPARISAAEASLSDDSPVPAAVLGNERIMRANHAFWHYVGLLWSGREVAGVPFASLLHPYDYRKFDMLLWAASRSAKAAAPVELRLRRMDGSTVATSMSAARLRGGSVLLRLHDAAARAPAETPEFSDDQRNRLVLNHIQQVAFQTDTDGRWLFLNPYWEKLTGFRIAESLGQPLLAFVHPDEAARNAEQLACLTDGRKESCWYETRLLTSDGGFRWVSARIRPLLSDDGKLIGSVGTLADVTKRRRNEDSLRASQRTFATLLGNFPGMIYRGRCDRNWTMEFVSDGCLELTGFEPCDLVDNLSVSFNELIHPEDREFVWRQVQATLAQDSAYQMEYRIVTKTGQVKWVWEHGRAVRSSAGELLALDGFITDITARKRAEDEAERNLLRDELTGLCNRATFNDRLGYVFAHATALRYAFAVLCLDLDDFKEINLRHGHPLGDRLLQAIGERLEQIQRPGNTVARLGSDEFAVLVTDLRGARPAADATPPEEGEPAASAPTDAALALRAAQLAEWLQQALCQPIVIDGDEFQVTASVGIALSLSSYGTASAMLQEAIEAAHRAKFLGPSRYGFADPVLHGKALGRRHIETPLLGAFDSSALRIYYRPIVELASGRIAWLEPVLRWQHPRRGELEFEAFRMIAEDHGLLAPIARWLLRGVCRQARSWEERLGPHVVCLPLTGSTLAEAGFVAEIERELDDNALDPARCIVQVSDIDAIIDAPAAQQALLALKELGVVISVDDDGRAPGGPLNLKSLVANRWKIDLGRVCQDGDRTRLRAVADAARAQNIPTIASGIRSEPMLALAREFGFAYGETPQLSEPLPVDAVERLLLSAR